MNYMKGILTVFRFPVDSNVMSELIESLTLKCVWII